MLSVQQMFYGNSEPVWVVDGSSPSPVQYHYLGSARREPAPRRAPISPPRRMRDPYYDYESPLADPYYPPPRRMANNVPTSRAPLGPLPVPPTSRAPLGPLPVPHTSRAPFAPVSANVQTPVHLVKSTLPVSSTAMPMPFSSSNPPPAPIVVPSETPISGTPVVPVGLVAGNTPYTLLLKVPICCEGCERRVVKKLLDVDGVMSVHCDIDLQRVIVRGIADTDEVLRVAKKAFKRSRLW